MFQKIRAADVLPSDVAKLLNVNRVTVSQWFNGHSQPHSMHADRVRKLVDVMNRAVDKGDLPVPDDVGRAERAGYLHHMIVRHALEIRAERLAQTA